MAETDMPPQRLAEIGDRITRAREAAGFSSRAAFATALETSYTQVRRWEVGSHEIGTLWLERVAKACGVSTDWILTGDGDGPVATQPTGTEG